MIEALTRTHPDWAVGIARIVLGIIFFGHGAQKMLGWYGGQGLASSVRTFKEHLHLPSILAFLVIAGEFFSGIGLIVVCSAESPHSSSCSRWLAPSQWFISDSASFWTGPEHRRDMGLNTICWPLH